MQRQLLLTCQPLDPSHEQRLGEKRFALNHTGDVLSTSSPAVLSKEILMIMARLVNDRDS